jgi:tRNA 2-thiouridine synthesizing protein A
MIGGIMNDPVVVDASGLSCPQPIILARRALKEHPKGQVVVLVDTGTSRDNVSRLAEREGSAVLVQETPSGGYRLVLTR